MDWILFFVIIATIVAVYTTLVVVVTSATYYLVLSADDRGLTEMTINIHLVMMVFSYVFLYVWYIS